MSESFFDRIITETINEYLDKEYLAPLYKYLKNGERYSSNGTFHSSPKLAVAFLFDTSFLSTLSSGELCTMKEIYLSQRKETDVNIARNGMRLSFIDIDTFDNISTEDAFEKISQHQDDVYKLLIHNPGFCALFDKYYLYVNKLDNTKKALGGKRYSKADLILMNPEINKNQWLVHFTDDINDAIDIMKDGFKRGIRSSEMENLAFTNSPYIDRSEYGHYAYAYDVRSAVDGVGYGYHDGGRFGFDEFTARIGCRCAVMFRAPGVKVYHGTDRQEQVIFRDDQATNMVLLLKGWRQEGDESLRKSSVSRLDPIAYWRVVGGGRDMFYDGSITRCMKWVTENYPQYSKKLNSHNY